MYSIVQQIVVNPPYLLGAVLGPGNKAQQRVVLVLSGGGVGLSGEGGSRQETVS